MPWSWVASPLAPLAGLAMGAEAPEPQAAVWGSLAPCPCRPSFYPQVVGVLSPTILHSFLLTAGHLHSTLWAPHLCPTPTPCSTAGGGPWPGECPLPSAAWPVAA